MEKQEKRDPELLASECKCGSKWVQMRVRMMMVNAKDGQKFIDLNCRHLSQKEERMKTHEEKGREGGRKREIDRL